MVENNLKIIKPAFLIFNIKLLFCGIFIFCTCLYKPNIFIGEYLNSSIQIGLAFLGCGLCGVISGWFKILNYYRLYCCLLIVIGVLNVYGIFKIHNMPIDHNIYKKFNDFIENATFENEVFVDRFQISYDCCGFHSYNDYIDKNNDRFKLPNSCCYQLNNKGLCTEYDEDLRLNGCHEIYMNIFEKMKNLNIATRLISLIGKIVNFILSIYIISDYIYN